MDLIFLKLRKLVPISGLTTSIDYLVLYKLSVGHIQNPIQLKGAKVV